MKQAEWEQRRQHFTGIVTLLGWQCFFPSHLIKISSGDCGIIHYRLAGLLGAKHMQTGQKNEFKHYIT
jgi:hypothetical protein